MPEGHTIHRIAHDHRKWFVDQSTGLCSPQGRFEREARKLDGSILRNVIAHGKHLFYHWGPQKIVHVHLGLYGKFRMHKNPAQKKSARRNPPKKKSAKGCRIQLAHLRYHNPTTPRGLSSSSTRTLVARYPSRTLASLADSRSNFGYDAATNDG